ncbi:MAG: helix-turn-helix domain-containing protein [Pyrinomonadaceae bacterium MAG19_C2-C3]|nr:helix-turn-helix domain-containing protein [Pyrinomonadaceae bacterium MAG19_C2-C3]
MNKQEACQFLNVSERSLARYAAQGKVQVTYMKGSRGNVAIYDDADLLRLKENLAQPTAIRLANENALPSMLSSPANPDNLAMQPLSGLAGIVGVLDRMAARDEAIIMALGALKPSMPIEHKLMLTLPEASQLSGISKDVLRKEIRANKLKASTGFGRGYRIKRADLDAFVKKI